MMRRLMDDDEFCNREPDAKELDDAQALVSTNFPQTRLKFEELANR
jgi:hypothetical protein